LTTTYYILKYDRAYKDLGADYFDRISKERILRYHVKRLENLGFKVELTEKQVA
jgi:hypothetical protein